MLIGQYSTKFTHKRRVAIPYRFKKELGNKMIIAKWYEGCLVLVKEENFGLLLARVLGDTKNLNQSVRETERFLLGSSYEAETDEQGRMVIPEVLAKYAKFKDEIIFIGLGARIELWEKQIWQKKEEVLVGNASQLVEKLAEKGEKDEK